MQVLRLEALSDNYIFLLCDRPNRGDCGCYTTTASAGAYGDRQKNIAAVVDPAQAQPVLKKLHELKLNLVAIFNTHHHSDHVGANKELIQLFPDVKVYGGAEDRGRIPGQKVFLQEGERVKFADRVAEVIFVPGHTRAHIAYYFPPQNPEETGELFCGDTLFAGGCGRLFEGTPTQMVESLSKLRSLPENTRVWCAHEYTLKNLQFALTVDGNNPHLQQRYDEVKAYRNRGEATVPSLLEIEKRTNPFLRWDQPALQSATKSKDSVQTFARLRGMKDRF
ncbi:hydroxyacylglutathione hydrolase [Chlorogloeopsis sp. ULAP01]|uniref:hydroxyacylglutathione hydrolase n=1 Tax=Chlorogloeopsis sp. ULAP01 TaxID=3056483 RepID=UPI0025AA8918|nr:hydroxyacylglutathione hydrolase [Chlorogloeopsis sp. ULAP01]MDM9379262.1 hydroxyacylglutathione hydrolase [Chlorogloeopsis sp. ULAP01]